MAGERYDIEAQAIALACALIGRTNAPAGQVLLAQIALSAARRAGLEEISERLAGLIDRWEQYLDAQGRNTRHFCAQELANELRALAGPEKGGAGRGH